MFQTIDSHRMQASQEGNRSIDRSVDQPRTDGGNDAYTAVLLYLDSVVVSVRAAPGHLEGEHRSGGKREEAVRRVLHPGLLQLRQKGVGGRIHLTHNVCVCAYDVRAQKMERGGRVKCVLRSRKKSYKGAAPSAPYDGRGRGAPLYVLKEIKQFSMQKSIPSNTFLEWRMHCA